MSGVRALALPAGGLAVAALGLVLPAAPAAATVELRAQAGIGGFYTPGDRVPVRITVHADRFIDGTVTVTTSTFDHEQRFTTQVEVPGGSVKDFWLLVPTADMGRTSLRAELRAGDDVVGATDSGLEFRGDQELVGVFPGLAQSGAVPATSGLAVDAGTAALVPIDLAMLDLGPGALDPADTLAMTAGDVDSLGPAQAQAVLAWIQAGGSLLVDAPSGTPLPALPADWQPGAAGYARAGAGEVRLTGGALAAGRWAEVLEPTATRSSDEEGLLRSNLYANVAVDQTLASSAGFRIPELRWLLAGLAVYVALAGPITWFVLRALGRPTLAWIVLPALAVLCSAGVYATGSELRRSAHAAYAAIYETGPGGTQATTFLMVTSRSGSDVSVSFPPTWTAGPSPTSFEQFADVDVAVTGDAVQAGAHLGPGQYAVVQGRGPAALQGGLEISATSAADGEVHGTVRNTLPVALDDVAVFTGRSRAARVGRLEPGGEQPWSIEDAAHFEYNPVAETSVWPSLAFDQFDGSGQPIVQEGEVDAGIWTALMQDRGSNFRTLGNVVAAGWTSELPPEATVHGAGPLGRGHALVLGRAAVSASGARLADAATVRRTVRGPLSILPPDGSIGAIFRFDLPPTVDGRPVDRGNLQMDVPGLFSVAEWWVGDHWTPIPREGQPRTVVDVPAAAVRADGAVLVRVNIPAVPPEPGREFVIYEKDTK